MKNQILFFAVSAICATSTLMLSASPAMAKGARFDFAPQYYPLEEPIHGPRSAFRPGVQHAPRTSVTNGSVPSASKLLGFNPSFLGPARNSTVSSTIITQAPAAVPQPQSMQNYSRPNVNPQQFGQPAHQSSLPIPASRPTQAVSNAHITGKLTGKPTSPRHQVAHTHSAAPQVFKTARLKPAPPQRVAKYGDNLYSPGETKPTATDVNAKQEVTGKVLSHH